MDTLEDLKARLTAVIDGYKAYTQKNTNNSNNEAPVRASTNLSGSVGKGGSNNAADTKLIQNLLNKNGASPTLVVDGICGPKTIAAISKFQRTKVGFSDSLIEPNKNSWKLLNGKKQPTTTTVASTKLSSSVGVGGANKPQDVLLVKTLLNKFYKTFNLNDTATNTKVSPVTIVTIKKFQQEKVGLTNPDGRIDAGGNSWKVLNGETQLTAEAPLQTNNTSGYNAALGQELAKRARSVANSMRTVKRCYAGTCKAVNGFIGKPILYGMSAYMGARLLAAQPKLFKEISASPSKVRSLPVGTIVVWAPGGGPSKVHGHIMICLGGGQEASDHINSAYNWPGGRCRAFIPISKG